MPRPRPTPGVKYPIPLRCIVADPIVGRHEPTYDDVVGYSRRGSGHFVDSDGAHVDLFGQVYAWDADAYAELKCIYDDAEAMLAGLQRRYDAALARLDRMEAPS